MLAIIEILLAPILTFIFELFVEFIFLGILYAITGVIIRTVESARDTIESVADDAAKTPEKRAVIIFFLIMSGFMAGAMISAIFPERIIKIGSITGISLLITPLIMGLLTSYVGRWEKEHDRGPSIMTTFLGGALFGLTVALTRLLFIIQTTGMISLDFRFRSLDILPMKPLLYLTGILFSLSSVAAEKQHSAVKPVPRGGGWMKRHESFNKRVAKGNVDLVFIGDSITQGWEGRGKGVWAKYYGKRNTVNLGIGGDRTQHVIWRLDNGNLKDITPKAAVIMIGTNNSGSNSSKEIAEGVEVIVKQIQAKSPKTKILLLGVFPRGTNNADKRRKVNKGANTIFSKLANGKSVHYLDIGPKFLQKDGTLTKEIMPDLLHLSEKGYTIWAESIESQLAKLLGE